MTSENPDKGEACADSGEIDCRSAVEELYHYLDGELTDNRRHEISHHLDLCSPCADAAGFEKELRQVVANRCQDRVPDSLKARIAEALHLEQAQTDAG